MTHPAPGSAASSTTSASTASTTSTASTSTTSASTTSTASAPLPLPLGRSAISRDAERRTQEGLVASLREEPSTRVLEVAAPHVRVTGPDALDLRPAAELRDEPGEWFYLGRDAEHSYLAFAPASPPRVERGATPPGWASLRDAGHLLSDAEAGLATAAVALSAWRRGHTHCPRCGAPTVLAESGWSARCERDSSTHYPRTDPAVIMTVRDGQDRLLLAHSAAWPERRRSVLAGFVEAGEGLEQAVRREVAEEVGIEVDELAYLGAQPWPFPGSLMVAFHGWVADGATPTPRPDGVEILRADFFTRNDLARAVASGEVVLPMRTSIARVLIESWFGGPVGD